MPVKYSQSRAWRHLTNKLSGISRALLIMGVFGKFLFYEISGGGLDQIHSVASIFIIIGGLTMALLHILEIFQPVPQKLKWELVFPELAGGKPGKYSRK